MAKTVTLEWKPFVSEGKKIPVKKAVGATLIGAVGAAYITFVPHEAVFAMAENASTSWDNIWGTVLTVADMLCIGVIMFAGTIWMFGNRSKALEMLIGACSGYLIIRHAREFQSWLAGI